MEDIHHGHDKLPVLTEVVGSESHAEGDTGQGVVKVRHAVIESNTRGYDPYNSASPVPAGKAAIR
ncbi:MAG: hypothetical protein OEM63_01030 [Gammaproteobacteria bacterium]|nr:hypothetical protein [Gammaproteobacteria bacterium]